MDITQAVILAGGRGERLRPYTDTSPKPMYPINGRPFLEYLIYQARDWGITDIVILLGYLADKVTDYFGGGERFGVRIRYSVTPPEYETQLRLKEAEGMLDEHFLLMYCDNICPINFPRLVGDYGRNHAIIQLTAYANEDGYTRDNLIIGRDRLVTCYDKKRETPGLKGVDIGYALVSKSVFKYMGDGNDNFEAAVYPKLVKAGSLRATVTGHRYYSVGSYARIPLTEEFLLGRKYIFLDRDGVTNARPPRGEYVRKPEDFVWIDGARGAIKRLNDAGYRVILVTNQAGIARGVMTEQDFRNVQDKMEADLEAIGARIFATYHCPHGWDEGCDCRKPRPGMLYQAQRDYSIDLTRCVMIGDDERDMETARNADMRGILVNGGYTLSDAVDDMLEQEAYK